MIKLPEILTKRSREKWVEYLSAVQSYNLSLPESEWIQIIQQVFAFSDFMSQICIREPAILINLIDSGDLSKSYESMLYHQYLSQKLMGVTTEAELIQGLRHFRTREMLRIAIRDLSGQSRLEETMTEMSSLADACLELSLEQLYQWHCTKHGIPCSLEGEPQQPIVIAMGKLGAQELNFSSDIDLIFTFSKAGKTNSSQPLSNTEFFTGLCRQLIKTLGTATADGIVFRVDLNLRPYGENGPLVMYFDQMEHYYQTAGREWERYAWIKARPAAGDKLAGQRLLNILNPFIYRRYLDYGVFESLRDMKAKISMEVRCKGLQENIKLGPGGIREIEFFVQIFQLLRGGVVPLLQEPALLKVLDDLKDTNYITSNVRNELKAAYYFLRHTENRIQEYGDQQTHTLPQEEFTRSALAVSMGFVDWQSFKIRLLNHQTTVEKHFNNLLASEDHDQDKFIELKAVWKKNYKNEQCLEILQKAGFSDPHKVMNLLEDLRNAPGIRVLSLEGQISLEHLIPRVLDKTAGQSILILDRIITFFKAIQRRTCYFALLKENPAALDHLLKLTHASTWILKFIGRHPVLLDEMLDARTLYTPPDQTEMQKEIRLTAPADCNDPEHFMDALRIFKQTNVFRVAAADISGSLPLMKVSDHLSEIAAIILNQTMEAAWCALTTKHGIPICRLDQEKCKRGFVVIGYGKLGGLELGYGSDLDLVFLHAGTKEQTQGPHPLSTSQFFTRLGQKMIHILSTRTSAGRLYETDMRLRPEGSNGILVSHIDAFASYQAWTWEKQAILRARPICGDEQLALRFQKIRLQRLAQPRSKSKLQSEIIKMRIKMRKNIYKKSRKNYFDLKQDPGGIVDIEFLVQYLILLKAHEFTELLQWTDNIRLLDALGYYNIIDSDTVALLKNTYLIFRSKIHQLSLQEQPELVPASEFQSLQKKIIKIWDSKL